MRVYLETVRVVGGQEGLRAHSVVLQPLVGLVFATVVGVGRQVGHLVPVRAHHVHGTAHGRCLDDLPSDG